MYSIFEWQSITAQMHQLHSSIIYIRTGYLRFARRRLDNKIVDGALNYKQEIFDSIQDWKAHEKI